MTDDNGEVLDEVDPSSIRRIHLVGVAGTGMGSFAGMLKAAGYSVTGSDEKGRRGRSVKQVIDNPWRCCQWTNRKLAVLERLVMAS